VIKKTAGLSAMLSFFCIVGCSSSGTYLHDVNRSVADIQIAVKRLYGVATKSADDRVLYTPPLKKDPNDPLPPEKMKERVVARVVIDGDRRPYSILVQVYVQRRVGKNFVEEGLDETLSTVFAKEINRELIESRENRNVIDDFRAF
jgi:hypothetical protein